MAPGTLWLHPRPACSPARGGRPDPGTQGGTAQRERPGSCPGRCQAGSMWGPRPNTFFPESQSEKVEVLKTHQFFQQDFLGPFCVWASRGRGGCWGEAGDPAPALQPGCPACHPIAKREADGSWGPCPASQRDGYRATRLALGLGCHLATSSSDPRSKGLSPNLVAGSATLWARSGQRARKLCAYAWRAPAGSTLSSHKRPSEAGGRAGKVKGKTLLRTLGAGRCILPPLSHPNRL